MGSDGGHPANIAKGPAHIAMDAYLNYKENGRFVKRSEIRNALANPENDYIDILRDVFNSPKVVIDYVALHWYNRNILAPQCWWKDKQPIEPIVRQSLIKAIDLAEDLPIDSYWVPVGRRNIHPNNYPLGVYQPDEYPFEVLISRGEHQLTRIILTPPVPIHTRPETFKYPSTFWVVKRSDEVQPLGTTEILGELAITQLYEQRYEWDGDPAAPGPRW